jgi:hypothetical protein
MKAGAVRKDRKAYSQIFRSRPHLGVDFVIRFEYEITTHPAEELTKLVYFCSDEGECALNDLPPDQLRLLVKLLNRRGDEGWELIEMFFGKDGIVAFWKRAL